VRFQIAGEGDAVAIAHQNVRKARLIDWHFAAAQPVDLVLVAVGADHGNPEFGKTGPADQANITRTDDDDVQLCHERSCFLKIINMIPPPVLAAGREVRLIRHRPVAMSIASGVSVGSGYFPAFA
jgi:hypothetical protein